MPPRLHHSMAASPGLVPSHLAAAEHNQRSAQQLPLPLPPVRPSAQPDQIELSVASLLQGNPTRLRNTLLVSGPGPQHGTTYLHLLTHVRAASRLLYTNGRILLHLGLKSINAPDDRGYTPLMLAARMGNAAAVTALIALGADPNCHLLAMAASSGDATTMKALVVVKESLDPYDTSYMSRPPLHIILSVGTSEQLAAYAEILDFPLDIADPDGNTVWHLLVKEQRLDLIETLTTLRRGEALLLVVKPNTACVAPAELAKHRAADRAYDAIIGLVQRMKKEDESIHMMASRLQRALQARIRRRLDADDGEPVIW